VVRPPGTGTETWNSKASVRRRLGRSSARSAVSKGPWGVRLLVEDDAQQGFVDLDAPVVLDEAELPELVHEVVHARARGPHHLGKDLLRNLHPQSSRRPRHAVAC